MTKYELKKLQVEYKNVNGARETQELRIMEFMEQIERLEASIAISKVKEDELQAKIASAKVD